jgi:hypothetical protein
VRLERRNKTIGSFEWLKEHFGLRKRRFAMKFLGTILTVSLLAALSGCGSVAGCFDDRVVVGRSIAGGELTTANGGASVRLGGKNFQVTKDTVTWDQNGSVKLPAQWNEVELAEFFGDVSIEVDGHKLVDVKE